jgi:hypothetical protein
LFFPRPYLYAFVKKLTSVDGWRLSPPKLARSAVRLTVTDTLYPSDARQIRNSQAQQINLRNGFPLRQGFSNRAFLSALVLSVVTRSSQNAATADTGGLSARPSFYSAVFSICLLYAARGKLHFLWRPCEF